MKSICWQADVSLTVSGLFRWERLHFEGSRKLLHSRLIHSGLNGTSTTMGVINVRSANKEQIRSFSRINKPAFTIYIALRESLWKHCLNNLIDLKIRSAFTQPFLLVFSFSSHQFVALQAAFSQWEAVCEMFKGHSGDCCYAAEATQICFQCERTVWTVWTDTFALIGIFIIPVFPFFFFNSNHFHAPLIEIFSIPISGAWKYWTESAP